MRQRKEPVVDVVGEWLGGWAVVSVIVGAGWCALLAGDRRANTPPVRPAVALPGATLHGGWQRYTIDNGGTLDR